MDGDHFYDTTELGILREARRLVVCNLLPGLCLDSFTKRINALQASQIPTPERAATDAHVTPYDLVAPEVLIPGYTKVEYSSTFEGSRLWLYVLM